MDAVEVLPGNETCGSDRSSVGHKFFFMLLRHYNFQEQLRSVASNDCLDPDSITPTFTETSPRGKSWTQTISTCRDVFSRSYLSNGRAIGMVVVRRPYVVRPSRMYCG